MQDFTKLRVWQLSHELALEIYRCSRGFPQHERYGLQSQLRRAAASIPANLAEGSGRHGAAELRRFVHIASGSASELLYHIRLSRDLGYVNSRVADDLSRQCTSVLKMLRRFSEGLANSQ